MADFDLVRVAVHESGCYGVLTETDAPPFATTLERTYSLPEGKQHVKIPPGLWTCRRTYFNRGGYWTYEIAGVPGHSRLLFHKGNAETDSEGCVLLGSAFATAWLGVTASAMAFNEFMRRARERPYFLLDVRQDERISAVCA